MKLKISRKIFSQKFTGIHMLSKGAIMDFFLLWEQVLDYISKNDNQYYQMFSYDVFPTSMNDTTLVITPSKPYLVRWINGVYKGKLEQIVSSIAGKPMKVEIASPGAASNPPSPETSAPPRAPLAPPAPVPAPKPVPAPAIPFPEEENPTPSPLPETPPAAADPFPEEVAPPDFSSLTPKTADQVVLPDIRNYEELHEPSLFEPMTGVGETKKNFQPNPVNEEYTFETFVHGNCNEIAYQAAYAVAQTATNPNQADQKMNPLFIYGPSGLGKTHLLHAICNYIHTYKPSLSVLFVSSETFTNELIDAIQNHTMPKFRAKYRNLDFLLIDDVQFFGSRDSTKMEIFNTFNELFDKKKYIIMTSDRTPSDIDKLEDRLQSRFSSGLVAPISPPDYEICCIILQKRAEKMGITLPKDVVDYIASHINTNVRELEGAFNKLVTFSHIKKEPITLPFAREALKDQIPIESGQELTVDFIIDTVCKYYGVKKEKLLGNGRPKRIVIPRQIAMYLCRNELHESYPTLRDCFKRKDHSTVLYACERVENDMAKDPQTRAAIEAIRKMLRNR